jgi:type IV pilus assembly protein PilA
MLLKKLYEMRNKKGFTLVEIIVVLVILAVIAAIAVPSMIGFINDARRQALLGDARILMSAVQIYATEQAGSAAGKLGPVGAGNTLTAIAAAALPATAQPRINQLLAADVPEYGNLVAISINGEGAVTGIVYQRTTGTAPNQVHRWVSIINGVVAFSDAGVWPAT